MDIKDWVISAEAFEDSDWIISIRPTVEPIWRAVPIGMVLSASDAKRVAEWLNTGGAHDLWKIAENVFREGGIKTGE